MKIDKLHYLLLILFGFATTALLIESNDLLGKDPSEQQLVDQGREMEIMNFYPTPDDLKEAIERGEYDYDDLTPSIKVMMKMLEE